MTIVLLVEGKTETALKAVLKSFLDARASQENKAKVRLITKLMDSRLLNQERVRDQVLMSLRGVEVASVVGLLDVYPRFHSAQEAKEFLRRSGGGEPRFHAHAAQYEKEAWLLPFWEDICQKLKVKRQSPRANPDQVDLQKPPSHHLAELFRSAKRPYDKPGDAGAILRGKNLLIARWKGYRKPSPMDSSVTP